MGRFDDLTADIQEAQVAPQAGRFDDLTRDLEATTSPRESIRENPLIGAARQGLGAGVKTFRLPYELGEKLNRGSEVLGENVAEELGRRQVNPKLAATAGFATQLLSNPLTYAPAGGAVRPMVDLNKLAIPAGRRSLGFGKGVLKRIGKERANEVAQEMLEQGVMKPFSSSESMLSRVDDVAESSGKMIGEGMAALDKAGIKSIDPGKIAQNVYSSLKPSYRGGAYEAQQKIAEEIRDTILAHGKGPIDFKSAQTLKETLQDLGKFESSTNALKAAMFRKASSAIRKALEDAVDSAEKSLSSKVTSLAFPKSSKRIVPENLNISPPSLSGIPLSGTLNRYQKAKKTYGAAETAKEALRGRVAGEAVNMPVSLPSVIVGASRLSVGDIPGALASMGAFEALKRRGAGTTASLLNTASKARIHPAFLKALLASKGETKLLGQ